ncbi:MAG TPA: Nramp family divalent metal transporter [Mycobacteriales bacterium]|nr:Nramp family divalent metal transporter [Mycobacteriales bacterium]
MSSATLDPATIPAAPPWSAAVPTRRARLRRLLALLGPAFVVSVAYVDPGNFATNLAAGAGHGARLLWVVVAANGMAMLVQYLAGKLGLATGSSLPELCRQRYPRPVTWGLWLQAELVAMATDLAEFVGAAVALNLLFGVPLLPAGIITAGVTFALLSLRPQGRHRFEAVIIGMLGIILAGFLYQACAAGSPDHLAAGLLPGLDGGDGLLLATGIVGATVMPHAVYLHSDLSRRSAVRTDPRTAVRMHRVDVVVALGVAGAVNVAMLLVAASALHGGEPVRTLAEAHAGLAVHLGTGAALAFALALLASGLAASSVGTYSGDVIMQGFLRRSVPLATRRLVTMAPALLVLGLGIDPTRALVLSQVFLAVGIPFALVPLVLLTRRPDLMGLLVNRPLTTAAGAAVSALIITLNVGLLAGLLP